MDRLFRPAGLVFVFYKWCDGCDEIDPEIINERSDYFSYEQDEPYFKSGDINLTCKHAKACREVLARIANDRYFKEDENEPMDSGE